MGVHWSKPLLEQLLPVELWNRLREIQVDPSFDVSAASDYVIPFYNSKTGQHLKSMPMAHLLRASRRKMRAFCAQGIDVQYGKKLTNIEFDDQGKSVKAVFADGSSAEGSLLIGADGHRSLVRNLILGEEKGALSPIAGGIQLSGTSLCYNDAEKARHLRQLHPINWAGFHPDVPLCTWMASKHIYNLPCYIRTDGCSG
jgi:2-polyprenyl-6-methoxyphenol hydroxylase-like FAD-dependent oxidoreductase